jgi:cytochrome c biogenesis protein CcmG/thiol:disulfide interchange protein DsbE|tara:strand:- start:241 stop:753 length:513 start_codon:yes stop_codon:yes gene_type:complete
MKNKLLLLFLITIFLVIFITFYKGLKNTNIYTPKVNNNKDIPLFSVELFYSNKIINSTEIFEKDKFYILNIWSSWCVPCRQEHPLLMDLSKITEVIGLNYKDKKINAEKFLDEMGNPYQKILFDKDGTLAIEWGAYGVPESFLIYNKKILKRYIGPFNQTLIQEIKSLIQ